MPRSKKRITASAAIDPDLSTLLEKTLEGKRVISLQKGKRIFSQGERANAIYFIQSGRVKVSVLSPSGKEAVLAILEVHVTSLVKAPWSANRFE